MFRTLRQPRYAALSVLMLIVAIVCVAAGTWQITRYEDKHHENDDLRSNARRALTTVESLLPIVGQGSAPSTPAVEFRALRVSGTYDAAHQSLVRNRSLGDTLGFFVLTPLRTPDAVLLVVRGFVAQPASGATPRLTTPPTGEVTVLARAQAPETRHDVAAQLTGHQVQSINPGDQAGRLGVPVYNGYALLESGQPGADGLRTIPRPDLSNPAGGALEPQHFAYVIQWYLFALLALAAPFAMVRADTKREQDEEFDAPLPPDRDPTDPAQAAPIDPRAAKLADRYGRSLR